MSGDSESKSPGDESNYHALQGEFKGEYRGGRFSGRIPKEWVVAAAPAMKWVAYAIGVAIAILIVCCGLSLLVR